MTLEELTPIIIALVGSAGLWGFLSLRAKQAHEKAIKDDCQRAEFNDTLKEQVTRLNEKVDVLIDEKTSLMESMAEVKAELAEARATIRHLEEVLRRR